MAMAIAIDIDIDETEYPPKQQKEEGEEDAPEDKMEPPTTTTVRFSDLLQTAQDFVKSGGLETSLEKVSQIDETTTNNNNNNKSTDYRAFVLLVHPQHGLLELQCTRKKNKPPHVQLPGGHVDQDEFDQYSYLSGATKLYQAARAGCAREVYEEMGMDLRDQTTGLTRLLPFVVEVLGKESSKKKKEKSYSSCCPLPNEHKDRLFFIAQVTDDDFAKPDPSKRLLPPDNHGNKQALQELRLKLSVEHSGYQFESSVRNAVVALQWHSGGKVSQALERASQIAITNTTTTTNTATTTSKPLRDVLAAATNIDPQERLVVP